MKKKSEKLTKKIKHKNVLMVGLSEFSRSAMWDFGSYTIENRALPDFRDGLKPVMRRILYGADGLNLTPNSKPKKSARLVGEVLGKYHPHGDTSCYGATVSLVNSAEPPMQGEGNWGTLTDGAAAMRYTNCRLSNYGKHVFFSEDYIPIIRNCPNYDGTLTEPVVLPALLPNVLINGIEGISVAATSIIPSFELKGVAKVIALGLKHGEVTTTDCFENLVFKSSSGGKAVLKTTEQKKEFRKLIETGVGSIDFEPDYVFDAKTRTVTITGVPPHCNLKAIDRLVEKPYVKLAYNATDKSTKKKGLKIEIVVELKKVSGMDIEDCMLEVVNSFRSTMNYKVNVTIRKFNEEQEKTRALFKSMSILTLFNKWIKWRIALEKRMLTYKIEKETSKLEYTKLVLLVAQNLKVYFEALKQKGQEKASEKYLMKKLKISEEQADQVMGLTGRQLKAYNKSVLKASIEKIKSEITIMEKDKVNPNKRITNFTLDLVKKV